MGFQPSGGVKEFIKLDDTPAAYTGQEAKVAKVAAGEGGLEFGYSPISVRKNSKMPVIGKRPQLNLIQGVGIAMQVMDNPPDDEVDIILSSATPFKHFTLLPEFAVLPAAGAPALTSTDGANFSYKTLDFDPAAEESCFWEHFLSPDYDDENIVLDIYWKATPAAGDVKFGVQVLGRAEGEVFDSALGLEQTVVDSTGGAGVLNRARITTFAPGWSGGDVILFKLARKAADAADTLAADAEVVKVVVSYTVTFKQSFYPIEPVDLEVGTLVWGDVDLSAYVPVGATGAVLHLVNTIAGGRFIGLRKKGSTDDLDDWMIDGDSHLWAMVGLDLGRTFQMSNTSTTKVYLIGYTGTGVVFFDNCYDKTPGVAQAWTDIDCSTEAPNAIGLIFQIINDDGSNVEPYCFRKNGSTDAKDANDIINPDTVSYVVIGCDAGQVCEAWIDDLQVKCYLVGYILEGCTFKTDHDDISLTTFDAWTDIDISTEAPKAIMAFIHIVWSGTKGLRKNGSSEDIYKEANTTWAMVACDLNQILEGKASATAINFYLDGYATYAED